MFKPLETIHFGYHTDVLKLGWVFLEVRLFQFATYVFVII